jgi:hypothetical protein
VQPILPFARSKSFAKNVRQTLHRFSGRAMGGEAHRS